MGPQFYSIQFNALYWEIDNVSPAEAGDAMFWGWARDLANEENT